MLTVVIVGLPRPFHGVMPYENGNAIGWSYTRL